MKLVVAGLISILIAAGCTSEDLPTEPGRQLREGEGRAGLQAIGAVVTVKNAGGYDPAAVTVAQGDSVRWNFQGPQQHTVTDASGMKLYNFRFKSGTAAYAFRGAGTYEYLCSRHASERGTVHVPIVAAPQEGDTGTVFQVTWASAPPASGFVFDVQVQRPGSSGFVAWLSGVRTTGAAFTPDAGPGTYAFQSRLRKTRGGQSGYGPPATITVSPPTTAPRLTLVAGGLTFPVYLTAPTNDSRLFVVELAGRIRVIENGQLLATPFLDISSRVLTGFDGGMLSMAFHPDYASNGRFFVYFSNVDGTVGIEEFAVSGDPNQAVPQPVAKIFSFPTVDRHHLGGLLAFGPDRKLYSSVGDGGSSANAQDLGTPFGKLVRLDVDAGPPYVPTDNPFVGDPSATGEVWAYGLRNPWRFSFDRLTGDLYLTDVGEDSFEEVDYAAWPDAGGQNYGWSLMEGSACYPPGTTCDPTGITLPIHEYDHTQGCSITGGYVYRGGAMPDLQGTYFYADYCAADVWSFRVVGGAATDHRSWPALSPGAPRIVSFGEDAAGELYVVTGNAGTVYKITP